MAIREIERIFRSHMMWRPQTLIRDSKGGLWDRVTFMLSAEG